MNRSDRFCTLCRRGRRAPAARPRVVSSPSGHLTMASSEDLKLACRRGLDPSTRQSVWLRLVNAGARSDFYVAALREVFGTADPRPESIFRVRFSPARSASPRVQAHSMTSGGDAT